MDERVIGTIIVLYKSGAGLKQIAHQYGVSPQTIQRHLISAGVEIRGSASRRIQQMLAAGQRPEDVAESLRIGVKYVKTFTPYKKKKDGYALSEPSRNAVNIRNMRKKRKQEQEKNECN